MNESLAYRIPDACRIAACSRTMLYAALKEGSLRARKRGRATIILASDLRRWLDGLKPYAPTA